MYVLPLLVRGSKLFETLQYYIYQYVNLYS